AGLVLSMAAMAQAEGLKPFVLGAEPQQTDLEQAAAAVKTSLQGQGFEVAGSYAPYPNAVVIVVTSEALKANAAKSDFGGYGAAMRVAVTKVKDKLQVSYTNPPYWATAYRMQGNLEDVKTKLEAALGKQKEYGSQDGITEKKLRKYNYMMGMAKFDSLGDHELATFKTYQEAVNAVEAGLAAGKTGVTKVYRIDVPGKEETVFGVAIAKGKGADKYVMDYIDFADVKSTAHLPYEILVSGNKVYHLFAKFRIAISFPDLSMMGSNSFMSIMSAPGAIKDALTETVTPAAEKK
ncbi:MAG: hypothetical protein H6Q05_5117, partial [Acidobacteria bacterium]|nr:hypothetical protein [Acidobacteriota bacterium]